VNEIVVIDPACVASLGLDAGASPSGIEMGVHMGDLPPGAQLQVSTRHHTYSIEKLTGLNARISGHPEYCAEPVEVLIGGGSCGGSMLRPGYIGRGLRLEFWHPAHKLVATSKVVDIQLLGEKLLG
jgi:hypothetical protein